jgi:phosphatidylglycerophosphatase A
MSRLVAIFFGVGLLRPAAGTWGSAAALLLGMSLLHWAGFRALVAATALATAAGFWACAAELADRPGDDPGEFVIDEVAGQWLTLLFPAAGFTFAPAAAAWVAAHGGWLPWPAWIFPFLMFRLFDIWKPWVIGRADRRGDAAGVMLDDLWAGLFAGVLTLLLAMAWHIPIMLSAR